MKLNFFLALFLVSNFCNAGDIEKDLRDLVKLNLEYTGAEDAVAVMGTMHTQSPSYLLTRQALHQVFENYKIKYELISYSYIGTDGDLAYARIKQRTTKVDGPAFNNNEIDAVLIFRKENAQWKIWTQANIDIDYVN